MAETQETYTYYGHVYVPFAVFRGKLLNMFAGELYDDLITACKAAL